MSEAVVFPVLDLHDASLSNRVNAAIRREVFGFQNGLADGIESARVEGAPRSPRASVDVRCGVAFASADFVSVWCEGSMDVGAAHPTKSSVELNLELPSMREVRLDDLFVPGGAWRNALSSLCAAAFARESGEDVSDDGCPGDTTRRFVVGEDGIRFYFEDDLPFVVGSVHPSVGWDALAPYLRSNGVVAGVRASCAYAAAAP